jgi:hypothetical protein
MVPARTTERDFCTQLHEWIHCHFDYPPDVCKNPDGTNKPNGSVVIYDPKDPWDQIHRSSGELWATAVEMACRLARDFCYRCKGLKGDNPQLPNGDWNPVWEDEFMLHTLGGYFWSNLVGLGENIQKLLCR